MRHPVSLSIAAFLIGGVIPLHSQIRLTSGTGWPIQLIINTDQVFDTSASEFLPPMPNQGSWSAGGNQLPSYFHTFDPYPPDCTGCQDARMRAYATFDLTGLTVPTTSAYLHLEYFSWSGMNPFDLLVFDVSTSAADLNQPSGGGAAVFNDLGSGNLYASVDLPNLNPTIGFGGNASILDIPLSAQAVVDINAAHGGFFSIGAAGTDSPEPAAFSLVLIGGALCVWRRALRGAR